MNPYEEKNVLNLLVNYGDLTDCKMNSNYLRIGTLDE